MKYCSVLTGVICNFLVPTKPRDITTSTVTRNSIFLSWQRPDPPNGAITSYTVSGVVQYLV